jgi:hypothetical protein
MQVYEILERAKGYLEKGWTRNVQAVDGGGFTCSPTSPEAARWCAEGALAAAVRGDWEGLRRVRDPLMEAMGDWQVPSDYAGPGNVYAREGNPATYNNVMGQEATIELFKKAIRSEKAKLGIQLDLPVEDKEEVLV